MQQEEKIFAEGFSFKRNENAPDFVIGRLSLKVEDAIAFMREHDRRGWINLNIKKARSGNHYVELDTFEPQNTSVSEGKNQSKETKPAKTKSKSEDSAAESDSELPF